MIANGTARLELRTQRRDLIRRRAIAVAQGDQQAYTENSELLLIVGATQVKMVTQANTPKMIGATP